MRETNSVIVTLAEHSYFKGVAALINSLGASGFSGKIVIGYRGDLPSWLEVAEGQLPSIGIKTYAMEGPLHFTYRKAELLNYASSDPNDYPSHLFYFDPDITINCPWDFFEKWADFGVALCEDINSPLGLTDPKRLQWKEFSESRGFTWRNELTEYANGGFIGLTKSTFGFISDWQKIIDLVLETVPESRNLIYPEPNYIFNVPDQDALNIALACTVHKLSITGKRNMDFEPGGTVMSHAIGSPKPWQKSFIRSSLNGHPPTTADKLYYKYASGPVSPYSPMTLTLKRMSLATASLIGRFMRRN